jgi:exodeoxyribonuclease VII large subunit
LSQRLNSATTYKIEQARQRLLNSSQTLHAVSPLATLNRGYALAIDSLGKVVRSVTELKVGDMIQTRLAHGQFSSQIKSVEE